MKNYTILLALTLIGCASTGILPMDRSSFIVVKQTSIPGLGMGPANNAKVSAYVEANKFCAAQGKMVNTISLEVEPSKPFQPGTASLQFTCVDKDEKVAPLQKEADRIIEIRQR